MENKYYTPEIEEFHVGFECEFIDEGRTRWIKCIIDWLNMDFITTNRDLMENKYRVKYLDREDIESLGWTLWSNIEVAEREKYASLLIGAISFFKIDEIGKAMSLLHFIGDEIVIYKKSEKTMRGYGSGVDMCLVYSGFIKNKSELKKLMQQLSI